MRRCLVALAVLALTSGSALAQTPPDQPAAGERGADRPAPNAADDHDGAWDHGGPRSHRPPPPSKAARIRIETGDLEIGIKCPEDESLRTCADFTLQLLDRVGNLPHR